MVKQGMDNPLAGTFHPGFIKFCLFNPSWCLRNLFGQEALIKVGSVQLSSYSGLLSLVTDRRGRIGHTLCLILYITSQPV